MMPIEEVKTNREIPVPTAVTLACANCETELKPKFAFCPVCGQSTEPKVESFGEVAKTFLEDYFSFDSKVFRSLRPLVTNPGFLTNEYIQGRRARYIPPLRMYVTISLLAFLLLAINKPNRTQLQLGSEEISALELDEIQKDLRSAHTPSSEDVIEVEEAFWDNFFDSTLPKLFFIMVPLYGLIQAMLYQRQRRYYMEHLIFSLHFHSFVFLMLLVYMLISSYLSARHASFNGILMTVLSVVTLVYLFIALKRVYQQNIAKTTVKFGLLLASYSATFVVFSLIALFVYYSFR